MSNNRRAVLTEEEQEALNKKLAEERLLYLADLKEILSTKAGKRFFNKYFSDSMIFETTFTGNSETFFKEGMRNVGLRMFDDVMQARPDLLLELAIKKGNYND